MKVLTNFIKEWELAKIVLGKTFSGEKSLTLSRITYQECVFKDLTLSKAFFSQVSFINCSFRNVKVLSKKGHILLDKVDFSNCDFDSVSLEKCKEILRFSGATFSNCSFKETELYNANIKDIEFNDCGLGIDFEGPRSSLEEVRISNCKGNLSIIGSQVVERVKIDKSDILLKADLCRIHETKVNQSTVSLYLNKANIVDIKGSNNRLRFWMLESKLQYAKLKDSLVFAPFVSGSDISSSNFKKCDLSGSFLAESTIFDCVFSGSSLEGTSFIESDIVSSVFSDCILGKLNLVNSKVEGSNLLEKSSNLLSLKLPIEEIKIEDLPIKNLKVEDTPQREIMPVDRFPFEDKRFRRLRPHIYPYKVGKDIEKLTRIKKLLKRALSLKEED